MGQLGADVGGLPAVHLTKVLAVLRCGGIAGTLSISSSGVMAFALLLASLSASNLSLLLVMPC